MGRAKTVQLVKPVDEEEEAFANAPLFEVSGDKTVAHILVQRTDPDEGTLGKVPPAFTEMDLKRKWGGGTFQLQARDEKNKPIKGGFRTVQIAGDPIFESPAAEKKWRRQQGLEAPAAAAAPASTGMGMQEIFAILKSSEASARIDSERRMAEQEAAHKRDLERLQVQGEQRERERRADDERRIREQRERDEREKRDREDREERRRKEDENNRHRDREFQVVLAQLAGRGSETSTGMLIKGIEIATKLADSGGGGNDPLTALAQGLPAILEKGKALLPGAASAAAAAKAPRGAAPAPAPGAAAADKTLLLEGPLGEKAVRVVAHFKALGMDPAQALERAIDALLQLGPAPSSPAPVAAPPPPEPTTAIPTAPAPAANGTAPAKPATTVP